MLSELFETKGESIFTFKKGDIITRVAPVAKMQTVVNENLGIATDVIVGYDNSFRGLPYEFLGIENNTIFLKDLVYGLSTCLLILEKYESNWALFKAPEGMTLEDILGKKSI